MGKFKVELKDGRYVFYHGRKKVNEHLLIKEANQLEVENKELKEEAKKDLKFLKHLKHNMEECGLDDTYLNDIIKCRGIIEQRINKLKIDGKD